MLHRRKRYKREAPTSGMRRATPAQVLIIIRKETVISFFLAAKDENPVIWASSLGPFQARGKCHMTRPSTSVPPDFGMGFPPAVDGSAEGACAAEKFTLKGREGSLEDPAELTGADLDSVGFVPWERPLVICKFLH